MTDQQPPFPVPPPSPVVQRSRALLRDGHADEAAAFLEEHYPPASAEQIPDVSALAAQANVFGSGGVAKAREAIARGRADHPDPHPFFALADAELALAVEDAAGAAQALAPLWDALPGNFRLRVDACRGRFAEALADCGTAEERAIVHWRAGDVARATAAFGEARQDPALVDGESRLRAADLFDGRLALSAGDLDRAVRTLRRVGADARDRGPEGLVYEADVLLAVALARRGDIDTASAVLEALPVEREELGTPLVVARALVLRAHGETDAARALLEARLAWLEARDNVAVGAWVREALSSL